MKQSGGALLSSIVIDKTVKKKISTQIYMGIRKIILTGGVKAGERLPASRTLATELGVSRTTILDVLDRLLSEGLLETRAGAGTFVSAVMDEERPNIIAQADQSVDDAKAVKARLSDSINRALPDLVARKKLPRETRSFITGLPALREFPMAQWARLSAKHLRDHRSHVMGYGHPYGLDQLREAIASHVNAMRGIHCDADQIFITGGAQHAFQLIGNMLLNAGDKVWIENPGAIGARNSLIANGAELVPVKVDEYGLSVEDGLRQSPDFKLAFVTPSHQQPLSVVMSLKRRFALLREAERGDAWIIEDDYDSEFHFEGQPLPTLKSVDTTDRVIYVGTFSKTLFPSLRTGFFIAPRNLITTIQQIFHSFQPGISTTPQAIIADFMDEGFFATHIRRMRGVYRQRHQALIQACREHLSDFLDIQETQSGLHTVGLLKTAQSECEIADILLQHNIYVLPFRRYCIAPMKRKGLVLGFGAVDSHTIRQDVAKMAQILGKI